MEHPVYLLCTDELYFFISSACKFVPVAIETRGAFGSKAYAFLKELNKRITSLSGTSVLHHIFSAFGAVGFGGVSLGHQKIVGAPGQAAAVSS